MFVTSLRSLKNSRAPDPHGQPELMANRDQELEALAIAIELAAMRLRQYSCSAIWSKVNDGYPCQIIGRP